MQRSVSNLLNRQQQHIKTALHITPSLNLPDLSFYNICNQQYRINRGVYNTIDDWFFKYGIIDVVYRRIYILAFLDFVSNKYKDKAESSKYIRFGHGGLTKALNTFISSYINEEEAVENNDFRGKSHEGKISSDCRSGILFS